MRIQKSLEEKKIVRTPSFLFLKGEGKEPHVSVRGDILESITLLLLLLFLFLFLFPFLLFLFRIFSYFISFESPLLGQLPGELGNVSLTVLYTYASETLGVLCLVDGYSNR